MAVVAKYFPAPGPAENYTNNPQLYSHVLSELDKALPADLAHKIDETGRISKAGDIKYIFTTKSGPGPIAQPLEESLIDPQTGLPRDAGSKHRKLQIS